MRKTKDLKSITLDLLPFDREPNFVFCIVLCCVVLCIVLSIFMTMENFVHTLLIFLTGTESDFHILFKFHSFVLFPTCYCVCTFLT